MGRIYKRGKNWWIQYYRGGQLFRESSRSALKSVASTLIKKREGDIADGRLPALQAEKTTLEDLVRLYIQDYEINKKKSIARARQLANHLTKEFKGLKALQITSTRINNYIITRQSEGAANATINLGVITESGVWRA